ncbi:MAG: rod shape-determining protein [Clostridiales bacterium]|nr:rod shape-determining protein [Clostridiales bacterium]
MFANWFSQDIGIDLGTANTLIYVKNKGIVLNEPSVIAVDESSKKILAVGKAAKAMLGRAPAHIRVVRPLEEGVISDFQMTQIMLREFLSKVVSERSWFTNVRVVVAVPSGVTNVEKRSVEEVVRQMGAREVFILDEPMAAAIGVGIPVEEPTGHMIADIGGGTSDIAIIALGGIVTATSLRHAGDEMNEAIVAYMRRNYNLLIGTETGEQIKMEIGSVYLDPEDPDAIRSMEAKGRDLLTGLPKTVTIHSTDVVKALEEPVEILVEGVKNTLENAPPELAADIVETGMVLAGGGAFLRGLDKLLEYHTGMTVTVAENALEAVAEGTGKSLQNISMIRRVSMKDRRY